MVTEGQVPSFTNQFPEGSQEAGKGRARQPFSRIFLLSSDDLLEQRGRGKLRVLLKREPFSGCDLPPHSVVHGSASSVWTIDPLGIQTLGHSLRTFIILFSGLCLQLPAYEPFPEGSHENEFLFSEAAHRNSQSSLTFFLRSGLKEL